MSPVGVTVGAKVEREAVGENDGYRVGDIVVVMLSRNDRMGPLQAPLGPSSGEDQKNIPPKLGT